MESKAQLQKVIDAVVADVRRVAPDAYRDAIETAKANGKPAPRRADFERFGIAAFTHDGELISAGNAAIKFPLQSIAKVFALEIALEALGERLWKRIGREPSGDPFSSIIDLERDKGIPRNAFINPGALVVCDVLIGLRGSDRSRHVVDFVQRQLGEKVELHPDVMRSGVTGGNLNRSLMYMARHHGNLRHKVEAVMDAYVHQCAITLDCRRLARTGFFLIQNPDERGSSATRRARRILSAMMLCGMYDRAGEFAYRVGIPAKSGVGGGILAIAPAKASIAVWSPALDPMGNSWLGTVGLERLVERLGWSVFGGPKR